MASPCELLFELDEQQQAQELLVAARVEALRIEQKFSRYRQDNIIYQINHAAGRKIKVDDETAELLDYAAFCYELSDGLFDITSGVLRAAWCFDGSDRVPDKQSVAACLARIGWNKVLWRRPYITLLDDMEIDLGGIGKEYAVDRTLKRLQQSTQASVLINYGGDIAVSSARNHDRPWTVAVAAMGETELAKNGQGQPLISMKHGGVATSGDAHRFLVKDGVRYGHILDPRTGWPVPDGPRSVTVHADSCTEAGILATLAMLQGDGAETFLQQQQLHYFYVHRN